MKMGHGRIAEKEVYITKKVVLIVELWYTLAKNVKAEKGNGRM